MSRAGWTAGVLWLALGAGCRDGKTDSGDASDSAVPTDTAGGGSGDSGTEDSGTGTDTDTDTDTDTGAGTDSGSDSGTGVDSDGDGWSADEDCDDDDPEVFPGAEELCNDIDDDCDPSTEDGGGIRLDDAAGFDSLQAAIDASTEGGVVSVCRGTFAEALVIPHSLSLTSESGSSATTIDAGGAGAAVQVTGGTVTLSGFTLTGGTGATVDGDTYGGGLSALDADEVIVQDCVVSGNTATYGGGIAAHVLTVDGGTVSGNTATNGGGVWLGEGQLADATISANEAAQGGGLEVDAAGSVELDTVAFSSNVVTGKGAGVYVGEGSSLTSSSSTWDGNSSGGGGAGLYVATDGAVTLGDDTFDNNRADGKGGAVNAYYAVVVADGTTFLGNLGDWGGAAFLYGAELTGSSLHIQYNEADLGGGLYVYVGSTATLTSSTITGQVASAGGGARVRSNSELTSDGCDWGTDSDDNSPDDIYLSTTTYDDYGADESFTCSSESDTCE